MNEIGMRIRKARKSKGWLQQELADRVGVTRQIASNWERGYTPPDTDGVAKIATALNMSVEFLLYGTEMETDSSIKKIALAIEDDKDLLAFFNDLSKREDLKLLFNQVRPLKNDAIKRIVKYIQLVEQEEDRE